MRKFYITLIEVSEAKAFKDKKKFWWTLAKNYITLLLLYWTRNSYTAKKKYSVLKLFNFCKKTQFYFSLQQYRWSLSYWEKLRDVFVKAFKKLKNFLLKCVDFNKI